MMKKLLILGAGILQFPVIQKAKEIGVYTIAMDANKDAIGFSVASMPIVIDICSPAIVLNKLNELKERGICIDGVIHPCSEVAMHTMGIINSTYKLSGLTNSQIPKVTNKALMRAAFQEYKAPSPFFYATKKYSDFLVAFKSIKKDVIIKPSRSSGSRGIFKAEKTSSEASLKRGFEFAYNQSRDKSVIIEEYISGSEFSVEIIIYNGNINVLAVTDKITTGTPHFVELGHSQPSKYSEKEIYEVKKAAILGCKALEIDNCAAHAEIKLQSGKAYIIEIGARLGGDFISTKLTPLSTGIDMVEAAILVSLGEKPNLLPKREPQAVAIRYFTPEPGRLISINYSKYKESSYIKELEVYCKPGDLIHKITSSLSRSGHVITISSNVEEAIKLASDVVNGIEYEILSL